MKNETAPLYKFLSKALGLKFSRQGTLDICLNKNDCVSKQQTFAVVRINKVLESLLFCAIARCMFQIVYRAYSGLPQGVYFECSKETRDMKQIRRLRPVKRCDNETYIKFGS